jgi:outer membrane immunogenic protein
MKNVLVGAFAMACVVTPAMSADLPVKAAPPIIAVYSWTGFYVGGNVGYTWGRSDYSLSYPNNGAAPPDFSVTEPAIQAAPAIAGTGRLNPDGVIGGLQAGYNRQFGRFDAGIEVDVSGSGLRKTSVLNTTFPIGANVFSGGPLNVTTSIKNDWLATLRPRFGVAFDRTLAYVTGGVAVGGVNYVQSNNWVSPALPSNVTDVGAVSQTKWGWTVGGGLAHAFNDKWSVRGEYLYTDLGRVSVVTQTFVGGPAFPPANTFTHTANLRTNTVRFGVDYKFAP